MHVLELLALLAPEADVRPPRLEILKIAARRHFQPFVDARRPHLDIVALGRGKAQIGGAEIEHPVGQLQQLQHLFGVLQQGFVLVVAGFRQHEFHHFHFVELVQPHQALGVFAVGAGLAPEAGRVGGVVNRQVLAAQHLVGEQIGHRHLRRGDEEEVFALDVVHVVFQFGQLAGAEHRLPVDQERRKDFGIAVLFDVQIQHEVDQCAHQFGAESGEIDKKRAGYFGAAGEIDELEILPQFPVRFRLEIECGNLAPALDLDIVLFAGAHRHGRMRDVGDADLNVVQLAFDLLDALIHGLDLRADLTHFGDFVVRRLLLLFQFSNFLRHPVAIGFELFHFRQQFAALLIQRPELR